MKVFLFTLFVLLIIVSIPYIFTFKSRQEKKACMQDGGYWRKSGINYPGIVLTNTNYCYYPTLDEGESCYENSECSVECVTYPSHTKDKDGYYIGRCGKYSMSVCSPTIPKKTKIKEELKGGPCI